MNRDYDPKKLEYILNNYGYTKNELEKIVDFFNGKGRFYGMPKFIRQLLAKMNILTANENEYYKMFEYLKNQFDLGCDILELGGGHYPILSEYIDSYQRNVGRGTITVMDPNLVVSKLGNIKLEKKHFNASTDITPYKLVIAVSPDDMFKTIVSKCAQDNIEYFIAICSCVATSYYRELYKKEKLLYESDEYNPIWDIILKDVLLKENLLYKGTNDVDVRMKSLWYCEHEESELQGDCDDVIRCLIRKK